MIPPNQKTILIVEDDFILARMGQKTLEQCGYKSIVANTGEEAIDIFEKTNTVDLILMDIDLGSGIDGTEAAAIILKKIDVPVVFLSSHTETEIVEKTEKITSYGYVVKGTGITVLDASIKMAFKLFDSRKKELEKEKALSLRKSYLSAIIENQPGLLWLKDPDGRFLSVNMEFAKSCCLDNSELLVGKTDMDIWPQELAVKYIADDDRVMKSGKPCTIEEPISDKGNIKWFETFKTPVFDNQGAIVGTTGYARDITERKKSDEILKQNESLLRRLVDILQHQSDSLQDFLDYALDQAIELTESKIGYIYHYHEERKEFVLNTWSKDVMADCSIINPSTCYELDKTGIWGEAVRQRRPIIVNDFQSENHLRKGYPEGHVQLTKFMTVPIFVGGKIVGVVGLANKNKDYNETDILQTSILMEAVWKVTTKMRAEDALRESEALLNETGAIAKIGGWKIDLKTQQLTWTKEVFNLHEVTDDFQPTVEKAINFYDGNSKTAIQKAVEDAIQLGIPFDLELDIITAKNNRLHVRTLGSVQKDINGKSISINGTFQDITERKKSEQERKETSTLFELVFNMNPDAAQITRLKDGCVINVNDGYTKICGFLKEEAIGKQTLDIGLWEHPSDRQNIINQLKENGFCSNFETIFKRKDGSRFVGLLSSRIFSYQDTPHIITVTRDITERKQAEIELNNLQMLLGTIIDSTKDFIWAVDPEHFGLLIFNNRLSDNFLKTRGIHVKVGMTPEDLYPRPDFIEEWKNLYQQTLREGAITTEYVGKTGPHIMELNLNLLKREGKIIGISAFGKDITERKRAEKALRESESHFRSVLENTNAGYFFIDAEGIIRDVNSAWVRMYKYDSKEEIIGQHFAFIQKIDDIEMAEEFVKGIMEGDTRYMTGEFSRKCKDNSVGWHTFSARPVIQSGKLLGIEGVIIDITERKHVK